MWCGILRRRLSPRMQSRPTRAHADRLPSGHAHATALGSRLAWRLGAAAMLMRGVAELLAREALTGDAEPSQTSLPASWLLPRNPTVRETCWIGGIIRKRSGGGGSTSFAASSLASLRNGCTPSSASSLAPSPPAPPAVPNIEHTTSISQFIDVLRLCAPF